MPRDLASCTHVFLRRDSVKAPLQAPYDGPFRVLQRADKFYTIEVNGRKNTVSLDCLKRAHLEHQMRQPAPTLSEIPNPHLSDSDSTDTIDNPSIRTTRSGRQVHPPNRLSFTFSLEGEYCRTIIPCMRILEKHSDLLYRALYSLSLSCVLICRNRIDQLLNLTSCVAGRLWWIDIPTCFMCTPREA